MRSKEDPCRDPASEARDDWAERDPNNLEGPGPTDKERRANARALSKLTVQERLELMFRGPQANPLDKNPES
jgi:hypothetical protein